MLLWWLRWWWYSHYGYTGELAPYRFLWRLTDRTYNTITARQITGDQTTIAGEPGALLYTPRSSTYNPSLRTVTSIRPLWNYSSCGSLCNPFVYHINTIHILLNKSLLLHEIMRCYYKKMIFFFRHSSWEKDLLWLALWHMSYAVLGWHATIYEKTKMTAIYRADGEKNENGDSRHLVYVNFLPYRTHTHSAPGRFHPAWNAISASAKHHTSLQGRWPPGAWWKATRRWPPLS